MRSALAWAGGLLVLLALSGSASAATPPRWPSAADVRAATPGLTAENASCIARYYHGRLSGKAWYTAYYNLTPAQKVVTDAGFARCMTVRQRTALAPELSKKVPGTIQRSSTGTSSAASAARNTCSRWPLSGFPGLP